MAVEVAACRTGSARYPDAAARVHEAGGQWTTIDCFDRCDACERALLAKLDGTLMRFRTVDELVEAVVALGEE